MKIAIIADPYIPVPPAGYGGIERIINMLIKEYNVRGHKVILIAHPGSKVECELIPYGIPPHEGIFSRAGELLELWRILLARRKDIDIIHNFGRLAAMLPLYFNKIPKIQSYQREVIKKNPWLVNKLAGGSIFFTACSDNCASYGSLPGRWQTIYNGAPSNMFEFRKSVADDAPLVFLGRLEEIKGAHTAIEAALAVKRKLVIAGNIVTKGKAYRYFKEKIKPYIDGINIRYAGEVNDAQKNSLLGASLALLLPIEWEDPCPVIVSESLACGTPVIGFKRGGLPEIIHDGISGFICRDKQEMIDKVNRIKEISRKKCREEFESRFSAGVIAGQYLDLYKRLLSKDYGR